MSGVQCRWMVCRDGIPGWFNNPQGRFLLRASCHALDRADDYGIRIPGVLDTAEWKLFQVQRNERGALCLCYSQPIDRYRRLTLVVRPLRPIWRVITCWTDGWEGLPGSRDYQP